MAHSQLITILRLLAGGLRQSVVPVLFLIGIAPAYAQQWHTTVEITYPAELMLPLSVSEVLFVNNTVAHPDEPLGAFYTLMAASELLEGSDYVPAVLETSQNESGSLYRKHLLSNQRADSLLRLYNSDALIVLNQLIVHPSTDGYQTEDETFYTYTQAIAASHWTLFITTDGGLSSRTLIYSDTLYWENEAETWEAAVQALPSAEDARNEMCVYVGEHFAERLLPTVTDEDRYLYDLGKNDAGVQYFARRQWQEAIDAWSALQKDKRHTAYAAANCAVAYELLGNLGAAYAAAGQALEILSTLHSADDRQQAVNMRYYQQQLSERMAR